MLAPSETFSFVIDWPNKLHLEDPKGVIRNIWKKYASRYIQLKVEHAVIGAYLAKIMVVEAPKC